MSNVNASTGGSLRNEIEVVLIPCVNLANENRDQREFHNSVNERKRLDIAQIGEFIFHIFLKLLNSSEFNNNHKNLSEPRLHSCFYSVRDSFLFFSSGKRL